VNPGHGDVARDGKTPLMVPTRVGEAHKVKKAGYDQGWRPENISK